MTESEFQKRLDHHDWYYMMSDDGWVYKRGLKAKQELEEIAKGSPVLARKYDDVWFKHFGPDFNSNNTREMAPMLRAGVYEL